MSIKVVMLERIVERIRGRGADWLRAKSYLREQAAASHPYDDSSNAGSGAQGAGIVLGTTRTTPGNVMPVEAPLDECGHCGIVGSTGSGKSRFVTRAFVERVRRQRGAATIDCKGELYEANQRWLGVIAAELPPHEREEFVRSLPIVHPFGRDALPPMNVCLPFAGAELAVQAYETTTRLAGLLDGGFSFQGENLCRELLMLLGEHKLSLVEAPLVLRDELLRSVLAERSSNEATRDFFFRTFPELPSVSIEALRTRLEALVLAENARLMLGADAVIDLKAILDQGLPMIAYLGKGPSVPEEQAEVLGSLFFGLITQAVYALSPGRRSYQIFIDEFVNLLGQPSLSRRFRTALTTFRSYKVHLGLVLHNFAQIDSALRETILCNADCIGVFRTSSRNAEFIGDFLDSRDAALLGDPSAAFASQRARRALLMERLQRLPTRHAWWYDRRKAHRAVLLRVADVPDPHEALGWTERQLDDFIRENGIDRGGFTLPRSVLRAQIAARAERLRQLVRPPIRVVSTTSEQARPAGRRKRRPSLG